MSGWTTANSIGTRDRRLCCSSGHLEQSLPRHPQDVLRLGGPSPETDSGDSLTLGRISPSHPACGERVVSVWLVAYLSLASLRGKDQANPLYWLTLHLTLPNDFCGVSASPVKACQNPQTCPIMSRRGRPTAVLQSDPLPLPLRQEQHGKSLACVARTLRKGLVLDPRKRKSDEAWARVLVGRINCRLIELTNLLSPEPATRGGFVLPLVAVSR